MYEFFELLAKSYIFRYSGILSAYGLALADVVHEAQEPCSEIYSCKYSHNFAVTHVSNRNYLMLKLCNY